jgi:hypothetical protein
MPMRCSDEAPMDNTTLDFVRAGSLEELKAKGRLVVHGRHRPILLVHEDGHVFALDNRCPHMGFPLDRGSIEDGILPCTGTMRASNWRAAAHSIYGQTMCRLVPSRSERAARSG